MPVWSSYYTRKRKKLHFAIRCRGIYWYKTILGEQSNEFEI